MHKILLVDDDENVMKLLGILFTAKGFDISRAYMGMQALDKIRSDAPNIVILDLKLPDMDGRDVLKSIKMLRQGPPVIVLSGKDDGGTVKEVMDLGAAAHFGKPFRPAELYGKVMHVLSAAK